MDVLTIREMKSKGINPEILFWVGCAGSFDDRAKKITKSFVNLLNKLNAIFSNSETILPTPNGGKTPPFTAVERSSEKRSATSAKGSPFFKSS